MFLAQSLLALRAEQAHERAQTRAGAQTPTPLIESKVRAADATPRLGGCWILRIAHAPSPKNLPKNGLPQKGGSLLWKALLQKNFQVRAYTHKGRAASLVRRARP